MILTIDTTQPMSDRDRTLIAALLGVSEASETTGGTDTRPDSPSASETPSEPSETPSESSGDDENAPDPDPALLAEAVDHGKRLMKAGKSSQIREALDAAGAARVTHLDSNDKIRAFIDAVS